MDGVGSACAAGKRACITPIPPRDTRPSQYRSSLAHSLLSQRYPTAPCFVAIGACLDEAHAIQPLLRIGVPHEPINELHASTTSGDHEAQFGVKVGPCVGQRFAMTAWQVHEPLCRSQHAGTAPAMNDPFGLAERRVAKLLREFLVPFETAALAEQPKPQPGVVPRRGLSHPEQARHATGETQIDECGVLEALRGSANVELRPQLFDVEAGY